MKKAICLLPVILVAVLLCSQAIAEEPMLLDITQQHAYENITSACYVGDTLYMLGTYGVYAYGENALTTAVDLSEASQYGFYQEPPEDESAVPAWEKAIRYLFTDGDSLYGLHPYSGKIYQIADGQLSKYAELPSELLYVDSEDFFREIRGIVLESGKLILLLGTDSYDDYEKTELIAFDLSTQEYQTLSPEGVQNIAGGPEGKLLAYVQGDESAIWQYDIASDSLETQVALIEEGVKPTGMVSYGGQPVYYCQNRVILAENVDQSLVKAYMPVMYAFDTTQAACSENGTYAYPEGSKVFLRNIAIEGEADQKVLTLMGDVPSDMIVSFSISNPDIAIVCVQSLNSDELRQAAISGDNSVDLFVLSAPGVFSAMKEKGYIAPLNGDEALVAEAKTLYQRIQDVVFDGDQLVGYPISIAPQTWTVNETKWQEFELGEYPVTYDELFEKIALWLDHYADEYPEYTLSDVQQLGTSNLIWNIVEAYIAQVESRGEQVSFDTPAFRAMLKSVSEHIDLISEDHDQWGAALLSSNNQGFGTSYADRDLMRMVVPPAIEPDENHSMVANVNVLCVNAASQQTEDAMKFIGFCAAHLSNSIRYELHPTLNDPIENDTYQSRVETLREELEQLKTRLETADDDKKEGIEDEIAQKQATIEYVEGDKWEISPESIAIYREVAQNLYVPYQSALLSHDSTGGYASLRAVVDQHCAEGFTEADIDVLIADLDRVSEMVRMENM